MPRGHSRRLLVLALALAVGMGGLFGCSRQGREADLSALFISDRRFNIDDSRGLVRVYARLENTGDSHCREVEVYATLVSAGGDKAGENSLLLQDIQPREKRDFAMTVTSHAATHDVVLEVRKPGNP